MALLVPSSAEDSLHTCLKYQRDLGINYLVGIKAAGAPGDVLVSSLRNGATDVYVHSKLTIADDELVLIGSTNIGQRSMTHDSELHVGIVDANETFARELRKTLWAEHTGRPSATLNDPIVAYGFLKADTAISNGHLRPYPLDSSVVYRPNASPPTGHEFALRKLVDPYAGPPDLA